MTKLTSFPLGPLNGTWYFPPTISESTAVSTAVSTAMEETPVGYGLDKDYSYEEEEEGEVDESEGRWK